MLTERQQVEEKTQTSDCPLEEPTAVVITDSNPTFGKPWRRLTKRQIRIIVAILVVVTFVATNVPVGMYLFSSKSKETLQLSLTMKDAGGNNAQQNVSTQANTVISHVVMNGADVTIHDDFDKDIQLIKIQSDSKVGCFITPLDKSYAFDPKAFPLPSYDASTTTDMNSTNTDHFSYDIAPTSINDVSFLSKRANTLCNNIPVYWLRPTCAKAAAETTTAPITLAPSKRSFSCAWTWKFCEVTISWKTFTYIGGAGFRCCLDSFCVWANVACSSCLVTVASYPLCSSVC